MKSIVVANWKMNPVTMREAKKLFDAANLMLNKIIDQNLIEARGIIGFYPCNSNEEDDIEVYDENNEN